MDKIEIKSSNHTFSGELSVPADKSIAHRALLIASLNKEMTKISNLTFSEDVRTISNDIQSTIKCLADIGVQFAEIKGNVFVRGRGIKDFIQSEGILDCGNSGTTTRLIMGLLSGQRFESKLTKKPILLDFTGWACANCRRVEENTWSVPKVYDLINNEFVLISLYVDDRSDLSSEDSIVLKDKNGNEKILDKVGEKWSAFQTINFKNNSQPYYVLLSPDLQLLNKPLQYTDTETYYEWLSEGLENFKSVNYFLK